MLEGSFKRMVLAFRRLSPQIDSTAGASHEHASTKWKHQLKFAILIALTLVLSAGYMLKELRRGWYPHDEGTLAQSAERVLLGEIPHIDFDEVYTGGLTFLNAAAFRVFGTNLGSLRYVAFAFFLAWLPATLYIATRFVSIPIACGVTLLAVAVGYPNYAAAMPSWYNLFFATFGLGALVRYVEDEKPWWLWLAGIFGGCSLLVKVSGLFYISAVFLFLLYRNGEKRRQRAEPRSVTGNRFLGSACVLAYTAALFWFLRFELNVVTIGYLFVPAVAIAGVISLREFREPQGGGMLASILRENTLFAVGLLTPLIPFTLFYSSESGLLALVRGVFILPQQRFGHQAVLVPSLLRFLIGFCADGAVMYSVFLAPQRISRWMRFAITLALSLAILLATQFSVVEKTAWSALWNLPVIVVLSGSIVLLQSRSPLVPGSSARLRLFALLSVTAGCSLIQYPFFAPIYFCYVAPLAILSCAAVLSVLQRPPRRFLATIALAIAVYMVFEVRPGFLTAMGNTYSPDVQTHYLKLQRAGGLRVNPESGATYEALVKAILDHARGQFIYATPDCPEVYFLAGFRNPTRTIFDFFDEPSDRSTRILSLIRAKQVNLVVLNRRPEFSGVVTEDLRLQLEKDFPNHQSIGRFEVRWKS